MHIMPPNSALELSSLKFVPHVKLLSEVNMLQILNLKLTLWRTYIEYDIAVPSVELAMQRFCNWDDTGAHNTPDFQPSGTILRTEEHKLDLLPDICSTEVIMWANACKFCSHELFNFPHSIPGI